MQTLPLLVCFSLHLTQTPSTSLQMSFMDDPIMHAAEAQSMACVSHVEITVNVTVGQTSSQIFMTWHLLIFQLSAHSHISH